MAYVLAGVVAITILLYVLLDGFDLGVGILFGLTTGKTHRSQLVDAVAPVWDGNETWLVMTGAVLFGAFPLIYATVLEAFYIPICVMLAALIFRGVAFEFRHHAIRAQWFWDGGFCVGSLIVAFTQGTAIGALAKGLPFHAGHLVGSPFNWVSAFSVLCGLALMFGYALLGATWLTFKCDGHVHRFANRLIPHLTICVCIMLLLIFISAIADDAAILKRWIRPNLRLVFPAVGAFAAMYVLRSQKSHGDRKPFLAVMLMFVSGFGALATSFWPYVLPYSVTIEQAAAPPESLTFMFWGIVVVFLPLTMSYTAMNYRMFREHSHSPR